MSNNKKTKGDNTMSTRKTLNEQIAAAQRELEQKQNRLKELTQKYKAQERRERTHRFCERHGYIESVLPEMKDLTDTEYKSFIDKTMLTDFARRILSGFVRQNNGNTKPDSTQTAPKPAQPSQANGVAATVETQRNAV
jgi:hypothetical protein